jgi:hypothetical protein
MERWDSVGVGKGNGVGGLKGEKSMMPEFLFICLIVIAVFVTFYIDDYGFCGAAFTGMCIYVYWSYANSPTWTGMGMFAAGILTEAIFKKQKESD